MKLPVCTLSYSHYSYRNFSSPLGTQLFEAASPTRINGWMRDYANIQNRPTQAASIKFEWHSEEHLSAAAAAATATATESTHCSSADSLMLHHWIGSRHRGSISSSNQCQHDKLRLLVHCSYNVDCITRKPIVDLSTVTKQPPELYGACVRHGQPHIGPLRIK